MSYEQIPSSIGIPLTATTTTTHKLKLQFVAQLIAIAHQAFSLKLLRSQLLLSVVFLSLEDDASSQVGHLTQFARQTIKMASNRSLAQSQLEVRNAFHHRLTRRCSC